MSKQWQALFLICTAVLCALSLWFSASVIADELIIHWHAARSVEAWLSAAVPAGFVVGAFFSALLGLADRIGRANVTIWSMAISGACALMIGFTFGAACGITLLVASIWGASIIADSAQYSALVSEVINEAYIGTALTIQMCIGYLLTIVSIYLVPIVQQTVGWQWVFTFLALGPIFGMFAMWKFKVA